MTMKSKKRIKAHSKEISNRYEYGKGMNFKCVQQELKLDEKRKNMPLEGDILYYKRRSGSGRINKWRFIKEETQGVNKGKWKVQGLHLADGAYNWFYPSSLKSLDEISKQEDLIKETTIAFNNKIKGSKKDESTHKVDKKVDCQQEDSPLEKKEEDVPLFTMTETREYLQISKYQLSEIVKNHNIKPYDNGTKKEFTESQIEELQKIVEKGKNAKAPDGWMTLSGARDYLNVGWQTVYNAMKAVGIEPIRKTFNGKGIKIITKDDAERLKEHLALKGFYKVSESKKAIMKLTHKGKQKSKNSQSLLDKPDLGKEVDSALAEYMIKNTTFKKEDKKEHEATKDLKIKNYKMIIGENLKMINSLVHQTKELLEKM